MDRDERRDPKEEALKAEGVLNPHPERVRDEWFERVEFFDARDLVQVKYEMLRRARREGKAVTEVAERFGLSRQTFYEAERKMEEAGLVGLVPKRPGPKGPHKLTGEVMAAVEARRAEEPEVSSEALARYVEERFGVSVHRRSIERALARGEEKRRKRR